MKGIIKTTVLEKMCEDYDILWLLAKQWTALSLDQQQSPTHQWGVQCTDHGPTPKQFIQNETINYTVNLTNSGVVVGKPVKWKKTVKLNKVGKVDVDIEVNEEIIRNVLGEMSWYVVL